MNSPASIPLRQRAAWAGLTDQQGELATTTIKELFAADPARGERLGAEGRRIYLDYCKNRVTYQPVALLAKLADESGLRERIDAMFRGDRINITEDRAVL